MHACHYSSSVFVLEKHANQAFQKLGLSCSVQDLAFTPISCLKNAVFPVNVDSFLFCFYTGTSWSHSWMYVKDAWADLFVGSLCLCAKDTKHKLFFQCLQKEHHVLKASSQIVHANRGAVAKFGESSNACLNLLIAHLSHCIHPKRNVCKRSRKSTVRSGL